MKNIKKRTRSEAGLEDICHQQKRWQHTDPFSQASYIKRMIKIRPTRIIRKRVKNRIRHPPYSLHQQRLVVFMRFGTLDDDDQRWFSSSEVAQRTGVRASAQCNIIQRWRKNGFQIQSGLHRCGKSKILSTDQQGYIIMKETLENQSHLSLHQRAAFFREHFDLSSFHPSTLRNYYRRLGVRYRKPQYHYYNKVMKGEEVRLQQKTYTSMITEVMMNTPEVEIVYVDETSFNLWQQPSRCWLQRDQSLVLPDNRGSSLSLLGAISERRGLVHYEVLTCSNNAITFSGFIARLKQRSPGKVIVVMDNLSVHKAKVVTELFDEENFKQVFLPTNSSTLNPIERLWAVIKKEWKQSQHWNAIQNNGLTSDQREQTSQIRIEEIASNIKWQVMRNIAKSHFRYMVKSLEGQMV